MGKPVSAKAVWVKGVESWMGMQRPRLRVEMKVTKSGLIPFLLSP